MRLTGIEVDGFRGLSGRIPFASPVALLVGENNSGKSAVVDALRLVLLPSDGGRPWINASDFTHDGQGNRQVDEFTIAATFENLDARDAGRLVSCLVDANTARIEFRGQLQVDGRVRPHWGGGAFGDNELEYLARETVTYTYLPPLRDAESDLAPGRSNRLARLLSNLAPDDVDRQKLEAIVEKANNDLAAAEPVMSARRGIAQRLDDMLGPAFRQQTDLKFTDPQFDRIVQNLRALIGGMAPLEMAQSGLGYNNILYMAALLAGMEHEPEEGLHVLLVEEPEAHLHPQLQHLLMRYLEETAANRPHIQVVVTTHSPNLTAAPRVERQTVLIRTQSETQARAIADFGLEQSELDHLHKFFDVTKASLLFARRVILVEGIAEQLLLPELARELDIDLAAQGVEVVNVGGLAFRPFVALFGDRRLPVRCALLTDSDPKWQTDDDREEDDKLDREGIRSPAAQRIAELESPWVNPFFARRTFEWDLVEAGNWEVAVEVLGQFRPRKASELERTWANRPADLESQASDLLASLEGGYKGRFAQALSRHLLEQRRRQQSAHAAEDAEGRSGPTGLVLVHVPEYIRQALAWLVSQSADPTT